MILDTHLKPREQAASLLEQHMDDFVAHHQVADGVDGEEENKALVRLARQIEALRTQVAMECSTPRAAGLRRKTGRL